MLTTDHRRPDPEPGIDEDPGSPASCAGSGTTTSVRPSAPGRLRRSSATTSPYWTASSPEFGPDAVAWWAMGGMSMSLLGRAREAGVPAVGVVVDEWLALRPPGRHLAARAGALAAGRPARRRAHRLGARPDRELAVCRATTCANARPPPESRSGPRPSSHPGIETGRFAPSRPRAAVEGRLSASGGRLAQGRRDGDRGAGRTPGVHAALRRRGRSRASRRARRGRGRGRGRAPGQLRSLDRAAIPGVLADADALCFCVEWPEPFGHRAARGDGGGRPVIATCNGARPSTCGMGELPEVEPATRSAVAGAVQRLAADPSCASGCGPRASRPRPPTRSGASTTPSGRRSRAPSGARRELRRRRWRSRSSPGTPARCSAAASTRCARTPTRARGGHRGR